MDAKEECNRLKKEMKREQASIYESIALLQRSICTSEPPIQHQTSTIKYAASSTSDVNATNTNIKRCTVCQEQCDIVEGNISSCGYHPGTLVYNKWRQREYSCCGVVVLNDNKMKPVYCSFRKHKLCT